MNTTQKIEAILFYSAEPVSYKYLGQILDLKESEIKDSLEELKKSFEGRGVCIVEHNGEVGMTTSPEMSEIIERVIKDENERELGRASLETLTIVAYKGPISRKEIEYIRGVNSQFALRILLLRGLIEKKNKEGDERVLMYNVTMDAVLHLGLQNIKDLPEYEEVNRKIEIKEYKLDQVEKSDDLENFDENNG